MAAVCGQASAWPGFQVSHQAIRIISRLTSEQCGKTSLLQGEAGDGKPSR